MGGANGIVIATLHSFTTGFHSRFLRSPAPSKGAHEQPGQALELSAAVRRSTSLVVEQQTQVGAHWGNASA